MFIALQFTIAKCWKQPKCPPVNEWIRKQWYIHTIECYTAERKGAPTLRACIDGTGEHYAKWNKPGSERQIPYDLTYKWNLINKTEKQAKYDQRHWNKEQTDSNQRVEGKGIMGERRGRGKQRNMNRGLMGTDKRAGGEALNVRVGGVGLRWAMGTTVTEYK